MFGYVGEFGPVNTAAVLNRAGVTGVYSAIAEARFSHSVGLGSYYEGSASSGSATHFLPDVARSKAVSECLERTASFTEIDVTKVPWTSQVARGDYLTLSDLLDAPLDPAVNQRIRDLEYTGYPLYPAVEGVSGTKRLVPAQAVLLGGAVQPEHTVSRWTSSGIARGTSVDTARLAALAELLERDAVMTNWYQGVAAEPLPLTLMDGHLGRHHYSQLHPWSVRIGRLPGLTKHLVVVACAVSSPDYWPHFVLGAAARPRSDLAGAAAAAYCEALGSFLHLRAQGIDESLRTTGDLLTDRLLQAAEPVAFADCVWFLPAHRDDRGDAESTGPPDRPEAVLEQTLLDLSDRGTTVYFADIEPVPGDRGSIVRAISPDVQPLNIDDELALLKPRRVHREQVWNLWHPFA